MVDGTGGPPIVCQVASMAGKLWATSSLAGLWGQSSAPGGCMTSLVGVWHGNRALSTWISPN